MSAFAKGADPAHRTEVPNERIFRLVCVESVACDPSVEVPLRRRRSAIALVEVVFLRSIPARAPLHARTGPEMSGEGHALRRKLESCDLPSLIISSWRRPTRLESRPTLVRVLLTWFVPIVAWRLFCARVRMPASSTTIVPFAAADESDFTSKRTISFDRAMSAFRTKADVFLKLQNVRFWPKADIPNCTAHVRSRGVKRTWVSALHMSAFDPKRHSAIAWSNR
jgi:hypothetical protein